jgi:hypothetical protein
MPLDKLTESEFFALFDESVHAELRKRLDEPGTIGLVSFDNIDICSSHCGDRTAMPVGPQWTLKSIEDATFPDGKPKFLGATPSVRQYAQAYYLKAT